MVKYILVKCEQTIRNKKSGVIETNTVNLALVIQQSVRTYQELVSVEIEAGPIEKLNQREDLQLEAKLPAWNPYWTAYDHVLLLDK